MTSQTYHADDGQLVKEHDQLVPEHNTMMPDTDLALVAEAPPAVPDVHLAVAEPELAEPDADLAAAEPDLAEPDADLAVAEPDLAERDADLAEPDADQPEPDADQPEHEDPALLPVGAVALTDHESATSIVSEYPGRGADAGSEEPEKADSSPGSPSLVPEAFTVPEPVAESDSAGNTASAGGPWKEIQAMFVDDPRASIERAAGVVDERVEALILSVKDRQRSMQSAWQADDAGTEVLRVSLQHYRTFWNSLDDLPAQD
jgi:hypothetical protein